MFYYGLQYLGALGGVGGLLFFAFWLWMCADCYKRRGMDNWLYFFFFMPPSVVVYFLLHYRYIVRSGVGGRNGFDPFGWGAKSKISDAEQQLRMADTLAARIELGELYYDAARYQECEAQYRNVLEREPQNLEATYHIGLCRLKLGDPAGALEHLQKAVARDKKLRFGIVWLRYTDCLVALGRSDEAIEERKKLSRAFPRPLMEYAYAQVLAAGGKRGEAREVLDYMLSTSKDAPLEDRMWLKKGKELLKTL